MSTRRQPPTGADPGLAPYLDALQATPSDAVLESLTEPCDPAATLPPSAKDRLLDPAPLPVENGWCRRPDGTGYAAVRTPMPEVTAPMVDWWFDWHPRRAERYRAWHPPAHLDNRLDPPEARGDRPHWGATHHPAEDFGEGRIDARIEFLDPVTFGFDPAASTGPGIGTIVCARVGDRVARHTLMAHVFLRDGGGLALRSHFWLGGGVELRLPGVLAGLNRPLGPALNSRALRRALLKDPTVKALAVHCAEEYTNLAAILPPLYERYEGGSNDDG